MLRLTKLLILLIVALSTIAIASAPILAQAANDPAAHDPAAPTVLDTSAYRLGADDVINVKVVNFPELSTEATVTPDGKIALPLLGPVTVVGQTITSLQKQLTVAWSKYVISPSVAVWVNRARTRMAIFYGYAAKSGPIGLPTGTHVLEALAAAGGPAPNGDLSQVTVTHKDGQKQVLDLSHPEDKGGSAVDILLSDGDIVYIPQRRTQFSVLGEVTRPGSYDYKDDMTVLDAITEVGGVKDTGDLANATLIHDGKQSSLNLKALLRDHDLTLNVHLSPGDAISVPAHSINYGVLGQVSKTGSYDYRDGMTLLDAMTEAGGVQDTADLDNATLVRNGTTTKLNLRGLLREGKLSLNIKLLPGDIITVPQLAAQYSILGAVTHPGSFDYRDNLTVLDVLTADGGVTDGADLGAATLEHNGAESKLDLNALLRQGDMAANKKISPGDRIMVPEIANRNYIFGAVARPGLYVLKPGDRVLDALNGAGGPLQGANLNDVRLIHVDRAKNTASVTKLDLAHFLTRGDMKSNLPVQAGDVLFIPDKKHHLGIGDVFSALSSLNFVTSALRIVGL